jgi:hypothetical protein
VERRRIGLLGATGYTGQRVLRELPARGEEPTLVGRNRSRCWPWPIASKRIFRWPRWMSPRRPTSPGSWSQASHGL